MFFSSQFRHPQEVHTVKKTRALIGLVQYRRLVSRSSWGGRVVQNERSPWVSGTQTFDVRMLYPLVNIQKTMENHHF